MNSIIQFHSRIIHGKPMRPHLAETTRRANPDWPMMQETCEVCGDTFLIPTHKGDAPNNVIPVSATACPSCGSRTELTFTTVSIKEI